MHNNFASSPCTVEPACYHHYCYYIPVLLLHYRCLSLSAAETFGHDWWRCVSIDLNFSICIFSWNLSTFCTRTLSHEPRCPFSSSWSPSVTEITIMIRSSVCFSFLCIFLFGIKQPALSNNRHVIMSSSSSPSSSPSLSWPPPHTQIAYNWGRTPPPSSSPYASFDHRFIASFSTLWERRTALIFRVLFSCFSLPFYLVLSCFLQWSKNNCSAAFWLKADAQYPHGSKILHTITPYSTPPPPLVHQL